LIAASSAPSPAAVVLPPCTDPYALPSVSPVRFSDLRNQPQASIRHVVATSTGGLGFVVPLAEGDLVGPDDLGTLIGSHAMAFALIGPGGETDHSHQTVVTMARATLQSGATPAIPLGVTVRSGDTVIQVPDLSAKVAIVITLGWSDGCFTYTGEVDTRAEVTLAAVVAACPSTLTQLQAAANALAQTPLKIGTATHQLTLGQWAATFSDGNGNESVAQFQGTDFKTPPQQIQAGKSVVVSEASVDLRIVSISAAFFPLNQVLADPSRASPDARFYTDGVVHVDGSVAIRVPTTRGKYLMETEVTWGTSCLSGSSQEWVTIQAI
jgi:hypothetical protein